MVEQVINYIKKAIKEHPIAEPNKNYIPKVYYMNSNDGTDFDWECNERTCELEVMYEGKNYVYIRVFVSKKGKIYGYVWNTTDNESVEELEPLDIGTAIASMIKNELRTFDKLNMYDFNIFDLEEGRQWGE